MGAGVICQPLPTRDGQTPASRRGRGNRLMSRSFQGPSRYHPSSSSSMEDSPTGKRTSPQQTRMWSNAQHSCGTTLQAEHNGPLHLRGAETLPRFSLRPQVWRGPPTAHESLIWGRVGGGRGCWSLLSVRSVGL